ncbi:taste receptor type 2 member 9-like [Phyllobates terribilis]|uniref:taste receptor type 2 member 9-like n=1 Tax=Phyllobates terribilis TaxID=111132 RepID=UPI003CCA7ED5
MADAAEGDAFVLNLSLLASAICALLPGLFIHSFIIGVNVNDWWKRRSTTTVDHILTCLGISRMCTQCTLTLYFILATFFLCGLDLVLVESIINPFYAFFFNSNIWLTALLSIIFCLKISTFRTTLFLYLKSMIIHRSGRVIVISLLLSAITSLVYMFIANNKIPNGETCNTTMDYPLSHLSYILSIYSFIIGSLTPLLFYFISSVLLFISLYHHTVKLKMRSNLSINLDTYYSAMKFVSFTFIYNTTYFIGYCACALYHVFHHALVAWPYIILDFLSVLHSSYMIYRTVKLRSQMSKVLQIVTNFLLERKSSETIETIEVVAR